MTKRATETRMTMKEAFKLAREQGKSRKDALMEALAAAGKSKTLVILTEEIEEVPAPAEPLIGAAPVKKSRRKTLTEE